MPTATQNTPRRIPPWIWLLGGAVYVICPLDFDFVPVLGWLDDIFVACMCIKQWNKGIGEPPLTDGSSEKERAGK